MTEESKRRITWGLLLFLGALGSASMRNNPALGITPLAVAVIEGIIYMCLLYAVRLSGWKMAALIAVITPVYLWGQRFLDGFMIPVEVLVNLTLIVCMCAVLRLRWHYGFKVILLAGSAVLAMLLCRTTALWIVKEENLLRALIFAWNTDIYSYLSLLGAVLLSIPANRNKARE